MKKAVKWGRQAYIDSDGKKKTVHSRVGEKRYGYDKIPVGFVIHHIDENKNNNARYNLILLHRKDHKRVHVKKSLKIESVRPSKEKAEE